MWWDGCTCVWKPFHVRFRVVKRTYVHILAAAPGKSERKGGKMKFSFLF